MVNEETRHSKGIVMLGTRPFFFHYRVTIGNIWFKLKS